MTLYRAYHEQIGQCDRQIEAHLGTFDDRSGGESLPPQDRQRKPHRNESQFEMRDHLHRATGVDLTRIDGIDGHTVLKVTSEIGKDMTRWSSVKHFTSWMGLCPGNKRSGVKVLSGRTKPCANRAAAALRLAAQALHRSKTALGAYFRRMKARLGAPKAITATAHKLARLIYFTLKQGWDYVDPGQDWYERQYRDRIVKSLYRRAKDLGFHLVPVYPIPLSS